MNEDEKISFIIEKLLNISNLYFNSYCEVHNKYILDNEEIENLEDDEEKIIAKELKEVDNFLEEAGTFLEEYKKIHLEAEEEER